MEAIIQKKTVLFFGLKLYFFGIIQLIAIPMMTTYVSILINNQVGLISYIHNVIGLRKNCLN